MKSSFTHALPIVMWDFSWLERHHRYGSFEDYNRVIDELVDRGYEAVRIDVFPHLIATDSAGRQQETFYFDCNAGFGSALWGRSFSVPLNVRSCMVEFIHKLQDRGIKIGLSTWITEVREGRAAAIGDLPDFIRIWDETLTFLEQNGCLENVIYVDLLNEYPLYHGYKSFTGTYNSYEKNSPEQGAFYWKFATDVLAALRTKWPHLRFLFSQTENHFTEYDLSRDYSLFDALDVHMWMIHNHKYSEPTGYFDKLHNSFYSGSDCSFAEVNRLLHEGYYQNEDSCNQWMAKHIAQAANLGRQYHIPVGNTEGWGTVSWADHPSLDWDLIKHAGLVSAQLAADNGYSFICSCNFCHPHFTGIWEDLAWHRQITDIIRKGKPINPVKNVS